MIRLVIFSCLFLAKFADSERPRKPTEQRIVGGRDTGITEVPYLVALLYNDGHGCGGSIIGPKHILTAAHCVDGRNPNLFSVRAGSSYHNRDGQEVKVVNVTKHPGFDKNVGDYDAAILELKDPLTVAKGVAIVTLGNSEPKEGDRILISGWGDVKENMGGSNLLQSVTLPVVYKPYCKGKYESSINVTDRMFCAGYLGGGKDSCLGDSGGPAVCKGKLVGVVSWGKGCARKYSPGIYTTVSSIIDWITGETQK